MTVNLGHIYITRFLFWGSEIRRSRTEGTIIIISVIIIIWVDVVVGYVAGLSGG